MKKLLVIGICGAGKSVLSKKLSKILDLDLIHLDQYYWKQNWVEPTKEEWNEKVKGLVKSPSWIMDGNYASSLNIRIPAADTIIFLDFSKYRAIFRAIKRTIRYFGRLRPDSANGCTERFSISFILYIWNYPKVHLNRVEEALKEFGNNKKIIRLSNPREVKAYLSNL